MHEVFIDLHFSFDFEMILHCACIFLLLLASEVIIRAKSNPNLLSSGYDIHSSPAPYNLAASSIDALSSSNHGSTLSIASQGSVKKQKKKGVFSVGAICLFFHKIFV